MPQEDNFLCRIQATHQLLESGIPGLDDDQNNNVMAYCSLLLDTALVSISSASYYRITKVRKFLRKVNTQLGSTMLVICMLSYPYTKLCRLDLEVIFPKLQIWTKENPGNTKLKCITQETYEQHGMKNLLDSATCRTSITFHLLFVFEARLRITDSPPKKRKRSADRLLYGSASNVLSQTVRVDQEAEGRSRDSTSSAVPSDPPRTSLVILPWVCSNDIENNEEIQSVDQIHNNVTFEIDDMPGLQLYILKNHLPRSIVDLRIDQLISWVQRYQSTSSSPLQFANVVNVLQDYQSNCPCLLCVQLIIPWYGPSPPYIDINVDSNMGLSAKIQLSLTLAYDLSQYVCGSWTSTTETANGGLA